MQVQLKPDDRVQNQADRWGTVLRVLGDYVEVQPAITVTPDGDNEVQQWPIVDITTVIRK